MLPNDKITENKTFRSKLKLSSKPFQEEIGVSSKNFVPKTSEQLVRVPLYIFQRNPIRITGKTVYIFIFFHRNSKYVFAYITIGCRPYLSLMRIILWIGCFPSRLLAWSSRENNKIRMIELENTQEIIDFDGVRLSKGILSTFNYLISIHGYPLRTQTELDAS